ncbi:hypothetical protein Purlil1_3351 [Purpureocillium lilacinum]|uniref:Uncharacterized protein n=1 Tax=Purpureocillium lilacinum TaxID=33203 RepID=A0ABR0C6U5_PURLI|nr:hypothetical protein Purlil1_3351 [Purpureocillium lilacinum]
MPATAACCPAGVTELDAREPQPPLCEGRAVQCIFPYERHRATTPTPELECPSAWRPPALPANRHLRALEHDGPTARWKQHSPEVRPAGAAAAQPQNSASTCSGGCLSVRLLILCCALARPQTSKAKHADIPHPIPICPSIIHLSLNSILHPSKSSLLSTNRRPSTLLHRQRPHPLLPWRAPASRWWWSQHFLFIALAPGTGPHTQPSLQAARHRPSRDVTQATKAALVDGQPEPPGPERAAFNRPSPPKATATTRLEVDATHSCSERPDSATGSLATSPVRIVIPALRCERDSAVPLLWPPRRRPRRPRRPRRNRRRVTKLTSNSRASPRSSPPVSTVAALAVVVTPHHLARRAVAAVVARFSPSRHLSIASSID